MACIQPEPHVGRRLRAVSWYQTRRHLGALIDMDHLRIYTMPQFGQVVDCDPRLEGSVFESDMLHAGAAHCSGPGVWWIREHRREKIEAVLGFYRYILECGIRHDPHLHLWQTHQKAGPRAQEVCAYLNARNGTTRAESERLVAMSQRAIVAAAEAEAADPNPRDNHADGPQTLDEYDVGQGRLVRAFRVAIQAALKRGKPMDHVLIDGPPGLGKTTLAQIIANELGVEMTQTSGPALEEADQEALVELLVGLDEGDVLFIDEIHRNGIQTEEFLYPAMETMRIDHLRDGVAETTELNHFTLIGATTRPGLISAPLRSRFGIHQHLDFYSPEQLERILSAYGERLELTCDADGLAEVAQRSRGTARIAKNLLRRVSDYALVEGSGRIDQPTADEALTELSIDAEGLDDLDRRYLEVLVRVYKGKPTGVRAVAAAMQVEPDVLEDVVEPYLLKTGFVARRPRGREITELGLEHLGEAQVESNGTLL